MKKVVDSLQALALELGKDAYLRSQKSGERGAGLFDDYWHAEYRFVFLSAFFALPAALRADEAVRGAAESALEAYEKGAKDKAGRDLYAFKNWKVFDRVARMKFFNGKAMKKVVVADFSKLKKLAKAEKLDV